MAAGRRMFDGIQLIVNFTATVCMLLFGIKNEIEINGSGLGLPKYLDWLKSFND